MKKSNKKVSNRYANVKPGTIKRSETGQAIIKFLKQGNTTEATMKKFDIGRGRVAVLRREENIPDKARAAAAKKAKTKKIKSDLLAAPPDKWSRDYASLLAQQGQDLLRWAQALRPEVYADSQHIAKA